MGLIVDIVPNHMGIMGGDNVAEKIVANYEYLSHDWPIHRTTGYEFANAVNGLFVNAEAEEQFTAHSYL
jgi:maltooligosyltrehalose synthase